MILNWIEYGCRLLSSLHFCALNAERGLVFAPLVVLRAKLEYNSILDKLLE